MRPNSLGPTRPFIARHDKRPGIRVGSPFGRCWLRLAALCVLPVAAAAAPTHDFPTLERVIYVQECMRAHPGPGFEMTSKCVCVLDTIAAQVSYDDFDTMSTVSKATTIAGERGGTIRDAPAMAEQLKRYRALQAQAEESCFVSASPR
jgi:hypothetical protein